MDFADFDLRTASEAGRWVHLEHSGKALYAQPDQTVGADPTDKPCRIHLRGIMAPGVRELIKTITRGQVALQARIGRAKDREIESLIEAAETKGEAALQDLICKAVAGWENIIIGGKPADPDRENLLRVCGPGTAFFGQVYEAILEQHDFLSDAARG